MYIMGKDQLFMQSWQCLTKNEIVPKALAHMEVHLHRAFYKKNIVTIMY
jgi:hypothetical protein